MPTMKPAAAAKIAPTTMATARRTGAKGITFCRLMAVTMPEKAPTLMKPAWPRLSSPRMPTVRFRETAMDM